MGQIPKFNTENEDLSCGMVEDVSQLDIKICGDKSCCFIQHLDNSDTNFRPGDEDRFDGAGGLLECHQ